MRIVVTGAAGGIGRAVLPDLVAHGHEVVAVDRVPPGVVAVAPGAPAAPTRRENACSMCRWRLPRRRPLHRRSSQSRCRWSPKSSLRSRSRPIP